MTYEEMDNARAVTSEKRIPKHGDENFRLGGTTGTGFPCEKRIPKHGDENTNADDIPVTTQVKKESPNMGTKTEWNVRCYR